MTRIKKVKTKIHHWWIFVLWKKGIYAFFFFATFFFATFFAAFFFAAIVVGELVAYKICFDLKASR
jgi:hypothetical protein